MVAAFAEILEEDDVLQLLEFVSEDLCGSCYAYMLTAAQGDKAAAKNSMIKDWIRRFSVSAGSSRAEGDSHKWYGTRYQFVVASAQVAPRNEVH